jgi:hypothetical protein
VGAPEIVSGQGEQFHILVCRRNLQRALAHTERLNMIVIHKPEMQTLVLDYQVFSS